MSANFVKYLQQSGSESLSSWCVVILGIDHGHTSACCPQPFSGTVGLMCCNVSCAGACSDGI